MIIFGPLLVIAGMLLFCWLLFTLAVYALPFYAGLTVGNWAFHTGAGVLGGAVVGIVAAGATFGIGQMALAFAPWMWLRLVIVFVYTAPAAIAGYFATQGIAQMTIPSSTWQTIFSIMGSIAVGMTAFIRIAETCPPTLGAKGVARA